MKYGFIKVASATPKIRVADCKTNTINIIEQIKRLEHHADVGAVFCGVDAFAGDIFAGVENVAARWRFEQIHAAQQRRFARA